MNILDFLLNNLFSLLMCVVILGATYWIKYKLTEVYDYVNSKLHKTFDKISKIENNVAFGTLYDSQNELKLKYNPSIESSVNESINNKNMNGNKNKISNNIDNHNDNKNIIEVKHTKQNNKHDDNNDDEYFEEQIEKEFDDIVNHSVLDINVNDKIFTIIN